MAIGDLTTLASVHAWLSLDQANAFTADDALLSRLITAQSARFVQEVDRDVLRQTYTEVLDGTSERIRSRSAPGMWSSGGYGLSGSRGYAINMLHSPIVSVAQVMVDGTLIPPRPVLAVGDPNAALTTDGYVIVENARLELTDGVQFTAGIGNVSIIYDAGANVPAEPTTVPISSPYTVLPALTLVSDRSVTRVSNSAALVKVASAPAVGQYSVSTAGLYAFNAADQGQAMLINYDCIPGDVEQAVIDMVAYAYRSRTRIGHVSTSIGGETVMLQTGAVPSSAASVIQNWLRPNV